MSKLYKESSKLEKTGQRTMADEMMSLARRLWPITRSLTGKGVRETLKIIQEDIPVQIKSIKSGTRCFDWKIPKEWVFKCAYIMNEKGERIIDADVNNLHVVGYSRPINKWMSKAELSKKLHFIKEMPDAIPYVTSYYNEDWGFCLSYEQYKKLPDGNYKVVIESRLINGNMNYGELILEGYSNEEVLLSTYICHPSMANNELSGPIITTFIAKELMRRKRRYTYRIIFIPETIGSIAYISRNLRTLRKRVKAGLVLTCIGDNGPFSYLQSRYGNNFSDKVVKRTLEKYYMDRDVKIWPWKERGSDERQFCSPGVDLPICSIMRSKYHTYPEYHTSKDNLDLLNEDSLYESWEYVRRVIELMEMNITPEAIHKCEPMLGKRNLYENLSKRGSSNTSQIMLDILSYSDGDADVIDIAKRLNLQEEEVHEVLINLEGHKLIKIK